MEIYSPKKFQSGSFKNNSQVKPTDRPGRGDDAKKVESREKVAHENGETMTERMKRVFYERLRAFFEYEEAS
jgi:hypothetical protein